MPKIRKLTKINFPRYLLFFDTESVVSAMRGGMEKHSFKIGSAYYVRLDSNANIIHDEEIRINSLEDFWLKLNHYLRYDKTLTVIAHNIKYDLINIDCFEQFKNYGYEMNFPIMNNAFILSGTKGNSRIKFIDTFNYVRKPLDKIGQSVGIPKMDVNPIMEKNLERLYEYCRNDVLIIKVFITNLIKFLVQNKLGSFKDTLASTSFDVWRHMDEYVEYHMNEELLKVEREAYTGGRTEAYWLGKLPKQNYYLLDVNSMYSYAMSQELPVKQVAFRENTPIEVLRDLMETHYVIARVKLNVRNEYGVVPFRDETGHLLFRVGEFSCLVHKPELKKLLDNNWIIKCLDTYVYETGYPLEPYVRYFYEMKKNATSEVDREIAKLFQNALYGRFALRHYGTKWICEETTRLMVDDCDTIGYHHIIGDGDYYVWYGQMAKTIIDELKPIRNINVALAGAVTSYSRALLLSYNEIAHFDNLYYNDTDSLVVNDVGYKNLKNYIDDKKLGYLKLEHEFNQGFIYGLKHYRFGERYRSKGVGRDALLHDDNSITFNRFTTFKDNLRDQDLFGRIEVAKELKFDYNKGMVYSLPGRVYPYGSGGVMKVVEPIRLRRYMMSELRRDMAHA